MALIAVTDINHGVAGDEGAEFHYFNAGDEVDESVFTDEQLEDLKRNGAVEESKSLEEVQDLRSQVEELQAKLAEMESKHAGLNNDVTNARAVDQTALDPLHGVPAGTVITPEYAEEHNLDVTFPDKDGKTTAQRTVSGKTQDVKQAPKTATNAPAQTTATPKPTSNA